MRGKWTNRLQVDQVLAVCLRKSSGEMELDMAHAQGGGCILQVLHHVSPNLLFERSCKNPEIGQSIPLQI